MEAASPGGQSASTALADESNDQIFSKYYTDKDYFLSLEGLLKVFSCIVCVVSAAVLVSGGSCGGAPALVAGAGAVALASAAASALLYAGVLLGAPLYAPQAYLFTDIIVSTVMGILLLITAVLSMTVCDFDNIANYLHGPLAMVNAGMVTASAVLTYAAVMRLWDAARRPRAPPPAASEQDA